MAPYPLEPIPPVASSAQCSPSSGHMGLVPVAAVELELVAVGLARGAVAYIDVQRVTVVGRLHGATRSSDRAELAGDPRPGLGAASDRRPVGGTQPGPLEVVPVVGAKP